MKNVSSAFREELKKDNRNYIKSADITLKSGTVLKVDNSDLWQNGMKLDTATSNPNSFDLGAIITGQLTLTLNNIDEKFSDYDFTDCTATNVKVGLKLPDGTTESLSYGKFYLNEAKYNGSIITLTFYDSIYKFDQPYSKSSLSYPATLRQIVQDACSVCGVTQGTFTFDQDDFVVQERPDDSSITFRQVLQWVGQIACYYFYADSQGRLSMKWYDLSAFEDADNIFLEDSDGNFVLDAQEDKIFTFVENGTIYPGTTMPHHNLASFVSLNTGLDDVVITGIKVIQEVDGESGGKEEISYQSGNDGYVLAVSKNKLIQGDSGNTIASLLGTKIIGMRFRTFSASGLSDPTIEAGDPVVLIDRKGNSYQSYITNNVFQPGAYQSTSLGAETPARKSATRYSQMSQVYVDYRKEIEKERTDREKALEELGERINDSSGLFTTIEEQPDGSKKYFLHNKPILSESDIVWSMTAEAWGVSTDGGKTQNAGMTVDGDTIVRILTAVGVNADWIKTGALRIEKNGQVMLNADIDTGQVDIVANSFSLRGRSIDEIAEQQLSDFVDAVYDPAISNLQSQIDGQIETWFYDYLPTIENAPANSWTTDSEKDKHLGDLFYVIDNEEYGGQAYRWAKIGTEHKWDYVEDTATVKALADAAKAQDTADQKRRVFITTPVPPYDSGDLWMQGASGDIVTCVNSRQSGNYVSTDWEKKNKYTDDTAVTELDQSLGQQGVFNRLTNNGKTKGLYLTEDNELYLNATYIKTGVITDNIGNNYWNLSNGEFRLSPTTTVGNQEIATKNNTISSVDVEYASGTSNTTPPETGWSTNSPEWQDNRYIWQRTVTTMADGTQNISEPTCIQGAAGLGGESTTIISNTVDYAISDSGTVPPNDWLENIPPLQPGKYLWTRTVTEYSDGESSIAYGVSYQGENGTNGTDGINGTDGTDGIGIVSSNVDYQVSDSGVTPPTGDWSDTVPDMEPGQFLWTRTQFTYTDGDVTTSYSVSYQGENGSQGVPGPPGEDGQTLYTWIKYADTPTSGMSDTPGGKKYLGIAYKKTSPIESTNYSDYSWSDIKGKDGIPGTPGKNGQTLYTWIKYATSASGANMSDNPTGRDYIGIAYNKTTATESTNPSDYAWSLIQGEAGIGVKGIVEQYYLSNSSTTQTGGSWSTAQPKWQKGKYIWTRSKITWTDNSVTYTDPVLAKAINGANEAVDDLDTSLDQQEVFNRLTNNKQTQGIILQNGQLYINASYLNTGIFQVSNAYGSETFYVNVDNGEVRIKATSFSLSDGRTIDTIANNAKNEAIQYTDSRLENFDPSDELTQQEVFNILTNGGTTQGIYLQGGRIYINASYIGSGTLDANRINAKGLSVYNNSGTRTFYIDSSGNVSINASSFMLSGDSIGTIINESTSGILSDANDYTDTKANSTLNSAKSYADSEASYALQQAKNYTDLKIENFDPDLTQQEVFNILTNNGQTQGIYLSGGRIYINASYIGSGTISANRIAASSITADKLNISDLSAAAAKIGGFILGSAGMRSDDNSLRIYGDGRIVFSDKATLTGEGSGLVVRYGMTVYTKSGTFSDGTGLFNLPSLKSSTGGNYLVRQGNLGSVSYRASSSKRYKNHVGELKKEEALKIIDLPVVRFIYKDGYLTETDRNIGREMPGFYAEDVEEISDLLCTYNEDGTVEDWNERTLIPYMLKTIQVQQERIDNLEAQINELKATVSNMKGA